MLSHQSMKLINKNNNHACCDDLEKLYTVEPSYKGHIGTSHFVLGGCPLFGV